MIDRIVIFSAAEILVDWRPNGKRSQNIFDFWNAPQIFDGSVVVYSQQGAIKIAVFANQKLGNFFLIHAFIQHLFSLLR